jgi:hypothetical protein
MKYLIVVLLLAGCATPEKMRTAYDEQLCAMPTWYMGPETFHAWLKEQKRRNIECLPAPGNPYPDGAVLVTY